VGIFSVRREEERRGEEMRGKERRGVEKTQQSNNTSKRSQKIGYCSGNRNEHGIRPDMDQLRIGLMENLRVCSLQSPWLLVGKFSVGQRGVWFGQ
jgi:hypothetical protein